MRKFVKVLILTVLFVNILMSTEVKANSCSSTEYEVTTAQAGGGFLFASCHADFASAEAAMNGIPNDINNTPVIRLDGKIVDMRGGIVDVTDASIAVPINVYPTSTSGTASKSFNGVFGGEMGFMDSYVSGGALQRVRGKIAGMTGWINDDSYVELIPTSHLADRLMDNNYYYVMDVADSAIDNLYHTRTYNNVLTARNIGPAPAWMVEGEKYYSFDGIHFYEDYVKMSTDLINATTVGSDYTHYNYYQYLSPRTRTKYNAYDLNKYLRDKGYNSIPSDPKESVLFDEAIHFINAQEKNGVNALMEYAWAIHESGYGTSDIAKTKYNVFGIAAYDTDPMNSANPFTSVEECVDYHARTWVSVGYSDVISDSRYFGASLGNKITGYNVKYATDPYWGEVIAGTMFNIDRELGFKDLNYYSVGVIQNGQIKDVYYNSQQVYKTWNDKLGVTIFDYPVTIVGETGSDYEIMMDSPMRESEEQDCTFISYHSSSGEYRVYDLADSYPVGTIGPVCSYDYKYSGFVNKDNITLVNNTNFNDPENLVLNMTNIYSTGFDLRNIKIEGRAIVTGFAMDYAHTHSKYLVLVGRNTENEYPYLAQDIDSYPENIDGIDYTFAGFKIESIDFTLLEDDIYDVYVKIYDQNSTIVSTTQLSDSVFSVTNTEAYDNLDKVELAVEANNLIMTKSTITAASTISLSNIVFNQDELTLEGIYSFTTQDMSAINTHTKKLIVKDETDSMVKEITLTNVDLGEDISNNVDHRFKGFTGTITELADLDDGIYSLHLELYDSSSTLVDSVQIESSWYSNPIDDYTYNNIEYSNPADTNLLIQKVDQGLKEVVHVLNKSELTGNVLTFEGYAFMLNIDNTASEVSHKIVLKNNDVEYSFDAVSTAGQYDLGQAYGHGYDYSKAWFEAAIDLDTVVPGDYIVYIEVATNLYRGREEILNSYHIDQPSYSNIGTKSLEYFLNKNKFSRLELTIAKHNLLFNPTKTNDIKPVHVLSDLGYTDNLVEVKGYSFVPKVDNNSHDVKMYLINEDGTTFEMTKVAWDGAYDLTSAFNDGYNYGNPWYHFQYDIDSLADGKYLLKLVLYQNGNEVGSELINAYNFDYSNPHSYNTKTYVLDTNVMFRYRIELNKQ